MCSQFNVTVSPEPSNPIPIITLDDVVDGDPTITVVEPWSHPLRVDSGVSFDDGQQPPKRVTFFHHLNSTFILMCSDIYGFPTSMDMFQLSDGRILRANYGDRDKGALGPKRIDDVSLDDPRLFGIGLHGDLLPWPEKEA